jgi:AraC family transcriptional regulator
MCVEHFAYRTRWSRATGDSHYRDVQRVIERMHEEIEKSWTLQELADIALISPFHFNRVFRQITGVPPCRFLWMIRLSWAKRLLATTRLRVLDVCYRVGYNSLGTFTRRFAELVGVPPLRFRQMACALDSPRIQTIYKRFANTPRRDARGICCRGHLNAPEGFKGVVVVGLYRTPIVDEKPVCWTLIRDGGPFCIPTFERGHWFLCALALNLAEDPIDWLLGERLLRGRAGERPLASFEVEPSSNEIWLRPPVFSDPPILPTLPLWLNSMDGCDDRSEWKAATPMTRAKAEVGVV